MKLSMKSVALTSFLGGIALISTACSSADEDVDPQDSQDEISASLTSCTKDADCVAVRQATCCDNGWHVAVNKNKVKAYEKTKPVVCNQMCAMHYVNDTRVAQCNDKRRCEMIAPEKMRCEGFVAPNYRHSCPTGYECDLSKHVPDIPGTCVASPKDAGVTSPPAHGPKCGNSQCAVGDVCCNPLSGICTKPGQMCAF